MRALQLLNVRGLPNPQRKKELHDISRLSHGKHVLCWQRVVGLFGFCTPRTSMPLLSLSAKLAVLGHASPQAVVAGGQGEPQRRGAQSTRQGSSSRSCAVLDSKVVELVAWLEGACVRHWPVDERAGLQATAVPDAAWHSHFERYLRELGCPLLEEGAGYDVEGIQIYVHWLIGQALAMQYEDTGAETETPRQANVLPHTSPRWSTFAADETNLTVNAAFAAPKSSVAAAVAGVVEAEQPVSAAGAQAGSGAGLSAPSKASRVDSAVTLDETASKALQQLAAVLEVDASEHGGDHEALLRACGRVLRRRILPYLDSSGGVAYAAEESKDVDLAAFPPGISTGNAAVDAAVTVLRMLYIADLREAQDAANDLIVTVQAFTANPRTDSSLGAVGR